MYPFFKRLSLGKSCKSDRGVCYGLGWAKNGLLASALVYGLSGGPAGAVTLINEVFFNPPSTDNGQEYFELTGTAGDSLTGLTLLAIEGDGTSAGTVDQALSLSSFTLGSNGLFLWRDAATVLSPAPGSATTLNVADFAPDLENGSNTYALVSGFSGSVGNDLDTNNDGTLDSTPWTSVLDAIGVVENDGSSNVAYGSQLGGAQFVQIAAFTPDVVFRAGGNWVGADVIGTAPGPYTLDPANNVFLNGSSAGVTGTLSPGGANAGATPVPVPPATLGLLAFAALGSWKLKRRQVAELKS